MSLLWFFANRLYLPTTYPTTHTPPVSVLCISTWLYYGNGDDDRKDQIPFRRGRGLYGDIRTVIRNYNYKHTTTDPQTEWNYTYAIEWIAPLFSGLHTIPVPVPVQPTNRLNEFRSSTQTYFCRAQRSLLLLLSVVTLETKTVSTTLVCKSIVFISFIATKQTTSSSPVISASDAYSMCTYERTHTIHQFRAPQY